MIRDAGAELSLFASLCACGPVGLLRADFRPPHCNQSREATVAVTRGACLETNPLDTEDEAKASERVKKNNECLQRKSTRWDGWVHSAHFCLVAVHSADHLALHGQT